MTPSARPSLIRSAIPYDAVRLRQLAKVITEALGIRMPDVKLTMLQSRLQRRLGQLGLASLGEYEARLRDPAHAAAERVHLLDLATTNKTDFFREPEHFRTLASEVLPTLAAGRSKWTLRLWCAGCSTGQEVYTLAMVLSEYARTQPGFDFSIIATDISTRALKAATEATYDAALAAQIPAPLRQRYVMRGKGTRAGVVRIVPELRAKVRFARLNFMDTSYPVPGELDVVFFRNVLIYFDRPTQDQVVNRICRHLRPGGYLFVAHTESFSSLDAPLEAVTSSVARRRA
jgi:chemotaxis protein methyltransferase CheR